MVHDHQAGIGDGAVTQYDFVLAALTRYDVSADLIITQSGASYALHIHANVLFLLGYGTQAENRPTLMKLQAGSFQVVNVFTDMGVTSVGSRVGSPAMFTDEATGDLICLLVGQDATPSLADMKVKRIQNATGAPTVSDITSATLGAAEGADKYIVGGASVDFDRRWVVFVDTQTAPATPRTFLTTWVPGGNTETWEWTGISTEIEAVASLQGISDDFALPYNTVGGGEHSPSTSRTSISGHAEVPGGTQITFQNNGIDSVRTLAFRGVDTEGSPNTVIPIVPASLTIGAGLLTGLLGYWKFSDFLDATANGNNWGSISGTPSFVAGLIGNALDLPAVANDALQDLGWGASANLLGFSSYAYSVWVNLDALPGANGSVISKTNGTTGHRLRIQSDGAVRWQHFSGGPDLDLLSDPGDMTAVAGWQHIVVSSDGVTAKLYVDGVEKASAAAADGNVNGQLLKIGDASLGGELLDCQIDELAAWVGRHLTVEEVGYIYNAGAGFELEGATPFAVTPTISGNTIINLLPDNGATLYTVDLTIDEPGVDIGEGDVGLIIPELA
jgi:hypothetical protein